MTNYYKNIVWLTRNTSLTITEINALPYFEYAMYIKELDQILKEEAEREQKRQEAEAKAYNNATNSNSMLNEIRQMMQQS